MDMTARRLEEAAAQSGNAREAINAKRAVKQGNKQTRRKDRGDVRFVEAVGNRQSGKLNHRLCARQ